MTWRKRIRIIWMTCGLGFTAWVVWNMQAHGVPAGVSQSSNSVVVERGRHATAFLPATKLTDDPFVVFLPGGGVDPDAYLPVARAFAERGWRTVLVELPWRVAFSEASQQEVWRRIGEARDRWGGGRPLVLGGHSRGAALAAQFAADHGGDLAGLLLIATTHPRDRDLSSLAVPVIKVTGTQDCVAPEDDSRANAHRLPVTTTWTSLPGANHAQFGYYGRQLGDCAASIDRTEQQRQMIDAVAAWLGHVRDVSRAVR